MFSRYQSIAFALGFVVRAAPALAVGFWSLLVLRALVPAAVVLAEARLRLVADAETSAKDTDKLMLWMLANLGRTVTTGSKRGARQKRPKI